MIGGLVAKITSTSFDKVVTIYIFVMQVLSGWSISTLVIVISRIFRLTFMKPIIQCIRNPNTGPSKFYN